MARERYLLHADEETIHSGELKRAPKTPKEKRENFWYYHKWHVLIAIGIAIVAALFLHDVFGKVRPDYQVGLITQYQVSQDVIDDYQAKLEKCANDRNGDGHITVEISNYAVGLSNMDPQRAQINETRLLGDLSDYSDMFFLCDEIGYTYIQQQGAWDTSHAKMALPKAMQHEGLTLTANMRVLYPDNDKKYTVHKEYWDASYRVYQKLIGKK
ncbi:MULTISPECIES: hypothetical protein [Caproicibacterium]|mgnify:CR=1 FL=1|jgi:hypothetical protein|uniref:Uncharacterized protein n=1 Tax=Caproicibacterium lactatifermentans TaxID=2666138 RepID=A0A859DNI2_9FIRM|nr:hypothetical protein [Caproicibacterium lactatifermentans]ARP49521.1 hypothetical protein B6259_00585 [Ruminococcaceae bacterium CPB6]MDD4806919.1 hypothetical protein [Oscillospiraceae bacterium]QKN23109.1 hypothetical protein GJQ69_00565 [Caproicibacterium lactatifermentans]QKO30285.1 hypothetical protein GKP14_04205 [Caproicibacterium lactatifermentans]